MSEELSSLDQVRVFWVGTESRIKDLAAMKKNASQGDNVCLDLAIENLLNAVRWLKKLEDRGTLK